MSHAYNLSIRGIEAGGSDVSVLIHPTEKARSLV